MNLQTIGNRSEILIPIFVLMIIFIMIMPLPTVLVDILIAFNICIAIIMLMIGIYMHSPLSFSSFPSVLLVATLFRLALSVTTTRLILLDADAGDIITTFGNFVVGGNLVVGIVIFVIITVVQFIVITKGSERVAEVAARFSLDGLQGKQMSIDGDLRAGVIDAQEARRRRAVLEKESQLFGSLDGSMKFVKGDAIAGIVITIINIIGGISIGTIQQEMSFGEAGTIYTILTVGDGLVNQIPALFIALASGIIVTRVTANEGNLGNNIGNQMFGNINAMLMAASAMFIFAIIPGFPTIIFLSLGGIIAVISIIKIIKQRQQKEHESQFIDASNNIDQSNNHSSALGDLPFTEAISLELDEDLNGVLKQDSLNAEFYNIRRQLNSDLGVNFPGVHLRFRKDLTQGLFKIDIHDVNVAKGILKPKSTLIETTEEIIEKLNIPYEKASLGYLPASLLWVDNIYQRKLVENDIKILSCEQVLILYLLRVLRIHAAEFIDTQEASDLTNRLKSDCSDLVRELLSVVPLQLIGEVLKKLVAENISIRNLRAISEAMLKYSKDQTDPDLLAEAVRVEIKRQISHKYADENHTIQAILLSQQTQDSFQKLIEENESKELILPNQQGRELIDKLKGIILKQASNQKALVLVVDNQLRRFIRSYTSTFLPMLPILAFKEIPPNITLEPVGNVSLGDNKTGTRGRLSRT